jgi:hypothetical protein
MKFLSFRILLVSSLIKVSFCFSQTANPDLETYLEKIVSIQDEDINYEDLYETLYQRLASPLDLNTCMAEDLRSLSVLSESQIQEFLLYRNNFGKILSVFELSAIPGWELSDIELIRPFVTIEENRSSDNLFRELLRPQRRFLLVRHHRTLQDRKGYRIPEFTYDSIFNSDGNLQEVEKRENNRYLGSPDKIYARFLSTSQGNYSFGLTTEKDAGEQLAWNPGKDQFGMDYYSFHFQLMNRGLLKNLIIGDYRLQTGQGLVFGQGFALGKGAETVHSVRRATTGLMPYTSVLEARFFRGAAATIGLKNFELTGFYSKNGEDAAFQFSDTAESGEPFIETIRNSGLHRTPSELDSKNSITSTTYGGVLRYFSPNRKFQVGSNFYRNEFNIPLRRRDAPRFALDLNQPDLNNVSVFADFKWRSLIFFGEYARNIDHGWGTIVGVNSRLGAHADFSIHYRNYRPDFFSFYSNGIAENTPSNNESGFYLGLKLEPVPNVTLDFYVDKFNFDWLRYQSDAPSNGFEWLSRITYRPSYDFSMFFQFRGQQKPENNISDTVRIHHLVQTYKNNFWLNLDWKASGNVHLRTRVQASSYDISGTHTYGYTVLQDFNIGIEKINLSFRFAYFNTEDYENRQYVYERNVLYAFSIPAYFNSGVRTYALFNYKISRHFQFWIRYSLTAYEDTNSISSGLNEIEGNRVQDITTQIKFVF